MLLLASVFGNGVNYLFMMFLARQLGMEDFGIYALGLTIFNALLLVAIAGIHTGTIKFESDISRARTCRSCAPGDCDCWWDRDRFWLDRRVRLASLGDSSLCAVAQETWTRDHPDMVHI